MARESPIAASATATVAISVAGFTGLGVERVAALTTTPTASVAVVVGVTGEIKGVNSGAPSLRVVSNGVVAVRGCARTAVNVGDIFKEDDCPTDAASEELRAWRSMRPRIPSLTAEATSDGA